MSPYSPHARDVPPASGRLGVVVVNYGSSALLRSNLAPVADYPPVAHVVVVDNPTTDAEREAVRRLSEEYGWVVLEPDCNLGFGAGVNLGAAACLARGCDQLLVLNPDASISADDVSRLSVAVARSPMTLVAPVIRASDGRVWFDGAGLEVATGDMVTADHLGRPGIEPWVSGACFVVSRQLWETTGGYDDGYFLYWEDVDLSRRVRECGGAVSVLREASAIHDEGGTQGAEAGNAAKSQTYYYFNIRNRMIYARRHLVPSVQRRWALRSVRAARAIVLRGGRRQLVQSWAPWQAALRGVRDGILGTEGNPATGGSSGGGGGDGARIRVLQTYMRPLPFHNPYVKMHDASLEATGQVTVLHFDFLTALFGRYDVVHAHWPEDVLAASSPSKAAVKRVAMLLWLVRLRLTGRPIVRTVHNLELPRGADLVKTALLRLVERWTDHRILISETSPRPEGAPYSHVLHGHYVDWFTRPDTAPVPGRIAYFGLVRRYKNVEALARAFVATRGVHPDWSLEIAGNPSSDGLVKGLREIVEGDSRVTLILRYLEDAELARVVADAELIVLPYREMHNSGSLLTALSLSTPALVPDNAANRAIAREVGDGWVHFYEGELTSDDLVRVMHDIHAAPPGPSPDLSRREWNVSAAGHLEAYRRALALRHREAGGRAYSS